LEGDRRPLADWIEDWIEDWIVDWSLSLSTGAVSTQTRSIYLPGAEQFASWLAADDRLVLRQTDRRRGTPEAQAVELPADTTVITPARLRL
jgi:hypothetical protein